MNGERIRIWLGFFVVSTVWGSTWLAIKIGLESVPPFLGAGLRFVIACALLWLIIRWRKLPIPFTSDAKKVYLSMGLLTCTAPFALVYWGQQFIPSALGSILFAAFPFWVAFFSHFMLTDERLDRYGLTGIIVGFLGVVIIFWGDFQLSDSRAILGMSAILLAVVVQALSLVQVKKWGHSVDPIVTNFVGMAIGMVALLSLGWVLESGQAIVWNTASVLSILYLSIVGTVLAFVTYFWLLKRIDAVYLSLTAFINPIVAVVLGALVLGERLGTTVFLGAFFVLSGILLANWKGLAAKLQRSS
jgi:drug/metabolite transporter (DMT)-like permease